MKKSLLYLVLILFANSVFGQINEPCGYDHYIQDLNKAFPGFSEQLDQQYMDAIRAINSQKLHKKESDTIYRIPVVFHIVYNTQNENLHDSLIESQMRILNECFRRKNADTNNTRDLFKPLAADIRVEFYMAQIDPNGDSTNGIVRQVTSKSTFYSGSTTLSMDEVKYSIRGGSDAWNTENYLNIWVCDLSFREIPIILGYAFPPVNATGWNQNAYVGKERQGVVLHYSIVGEGNPSNTSGPNSTSFRTAVHEVGHFLGLRHIWGDGPAQNGCNVDDFIDDTPVTATRNSGCNKLRNTCNEGQGDMPDMIENYMDYSPGTCVNMFTKMQANLMLHNLLNLRTGLAEIEAPEEPIILASRNVLYPNPIEDNVVLELIGIEPSTWYTIEITNALGQVIHSEKYHLQVDKTDIEMSFLTSGVYYLEIYKENDLLFAKKLVKY
jgi:hypothetical protein